MSLPQPYYSDDSVTIYHADCRDILPELPKVDLLIADPPYGESYKSNQVGRFQGVQLANDSDSNLRDWLMEWWGNRPAAIFGKWSVPKWGSPRGVLVWDKGTHVGMGDLTFPWKPNWEDIAIYGDGWAGHRDSSVLSGHCMVSWASGPVHRDHPTQKPVSLVAHLLSKIDASTILDPFLGSGTTAFAAKKLGRKCIGIEIEEKYCEIAAKRCSQMVMPLEVR